MPLYKGNTKIGAIYKGTTPISAIYKGSTLIFSSYTWQEWYVEYVYNTLVPTTINSKNVLDKAKVYTIYGNSVVENQLADFTVDFSTKSVNGITIETDLVNKTIRYYGTATANAICGFISSANDKKNLIVGHKYLLKINKTGNSKNSRCSVSGLSGSWLDMQDNIYTGIGTSQYGQVIVFSGEQVDFTISYEIIDLTQMFPFNTPTTLTDTRVQAILNRGYIPYNTGTLKNVDMSEVSFTNADTTSLQTLSLKYQGSGVNTAHDTMVIDNDNVVFTKNFVANIDAGSLSGWFYDSSGQRFANNDLQGVIKPPSSTSVSANVLWNKYKNIKYDDFVGGTSNKVFYVSLAGGIRMVDTSLNGDTSLISGSLTYQLATPQVITIPRKHIGVVDLGSLTNWNYDSTNHRVYAPLTNLKLGTLRRIAMYCNRYKTIQNGESLSQVGNMSIYGAGDTAVIYIHDTELENLTSSQIQEKLLGQYLYFNTQNESTIPNIIGVQSGGTITTNWFSWVKNQLNDDPFMSSVSNFSNSYGTISVLNNELTLTVNNTSNANIVYKSSGHTISFIKDHKYLFRVNAKTSSLSTTKIVCQVYNGSSWSYIQLDSTSYKDYSIIVSFTSNVSEQNYFRIIQVSQSQTVIGDTVSIKSLNVIDLTLGFPTDTPTTITDPRIQYILSQGYIAQDINGTNTNVPTQVLPNIDFLLKAK